MAYSTQTGTASQNASDSDVQSTGTTEAQLNSIYQALGVSSAEVVVTGGTKSINVTDANSAVLVNESTADQNTLNASSPNTAGGYSNIGSTATYVSNTSSTATYIKATEGASFVEYTGPGTATVDGGTVNTFVLDASHEAGALTAYASNGVNSHSQIIGSSGSDTLYGATTETTASVAINAGHGPTVAYAGVGAATVYAGGNTTVYGGSHAGQQLLDYGTNPDGSAYASHDTMYAGTGGTQTLAVVHGDNQLYDTNGLGGAQADTLSAGDGHDTLFGGSAGGVLNINNGITHVVSVGADTVNVNGNHTTVGNASTYDTISASSAQGVFSTVHFADAAQGTDFNSLVASAAANNGGSSSVTISFTTSSNQTQTVQLDNYTHIKFS